MEMMLQLCWVTFGNMGEKEKGICIYIYIYSLNATNAERILA